MASMEALSSSSNELFNIVIYDTISATPYISQTSTSPSLILSSPLDDNFHYGLHHDVVDQSAPSYITAKSEALAPEPDEPQGTEAGYNRKAGSAVGPAAGAVRKKRRRKPRVCKNKEEAETQRMTHIAVERNRRKQMNEHLAVLRSLMPESYVQRGEQASIVGGAIEFVKELEHLLQSLEAQKLQQDIQATTKPAVEGFEHNFNHDHNPNDYSHNQLDHDNQSNSMEMMSPKFPAPPFSQFFVFPQYTWSQISNKYTSKTKAAIADIEVTLIETHASIRILSQKSVRQLSKLVAGFHALHLTILHLNVITVTPLVLYSVSVKVEEECLLNSVDDIAGAVHHMLRIIEEEAALALC